MINELRLAKKQHYQWMADFHCELLCDVHNSSFAEQIASEHECAFGQWYDKAARYFQLLEDDVFLEIGEFHANLHHFAKRLHDEVIAGRSIAQQEYEGFSQTIRQFYEKIADLELHLWTSICLIDPLTGLRNRQGMLIELSDEQMRAIRTDDSCAIAMGDIDDFKAINDEYGHAAGDEILKQIAGILSDEMRVYDRLYRYGGEEFLFCFPHSSAAEAHNILQRIRHRIADTTMQVNSLPPLRLTMSFGMAMLQEGPIEENIKRADAALLSAKQAGKNQVRQDQA
jgi:diguanylate cyclase (GGDEF)-like protein